MSEIQNNNEEINYKKYFSFVLYLLVSLKSIYYYFTFIFFPETWFYNEVENNGSLFLTISLFLTFRLLKVWIISYLIIHLILLISIFYLCKNNWFILSYILTCITCLIESFQSALYNVVMDELTKDKKLYEIEKDFLELIDNIKEEEIEKKKKEILKDFPEDLKKPLNELFDEFIKINNEIKKKDYKRLVKFLIKEAEIIKKENNKKGK